MSKDKEIELLPNLAVEENKGSLFDYFSDETVLLIEDKVIFDDRAQSYEDQILASYQQLLDENIYPEEPTRRYLQKKTLDKQLKKLNKKLKKEEKQRLKKARRATAA